MPAAAKQLLLAGVTSARDLGAPLEDILAVRDAINRGEMPGPTLYVSGPFIQHEPYPGTEAFRWGVEGPGRRARQGAALADAGRRLIKLIDQDQMTMEEVQAVVDEAHSARPAGRGALPPRRGDPPRHRGGRGLLRAHRARHRARVPGGHLRPAEGARANTLFWTPTIGPLLLYEETRDDSPSGSTTRAGSEGLPQDVVEDIRPRSRTPRRLDLLPARPARAADAAAQVPAAPPVRRHPARSAPTAACRSTSTATPPGARSTPGCASSACRRWTPSAPPPTGPRVAMKVEKDVGTVRPGKYADVIAVRGDVLRHAGPAADVGSVIKRGVRYR